MFISVYIFNMVNLNACMSDLAKIYRILRMGLKMDSHFKMHSVLYTYQCVLGGGQQFIKNQ